MAERLTRQIHRDERTALESIFGNDATFPKRAWENIWKPLEVTIHLEPHHTGDEESQTFVSADLHVQCPESYPDSVPKLSVTQSKGLSQDQINELLAVLNYRCKELIGNSMILELCDVVRNFLYDRNNPPLGSFHEVMLRSKENQDFLLEREKETMEAREKEAIERERERQQLEAEWRSEVKESEGAIVDNVQPGSVIRSVAGREIAVSSVLVNRPCHPMCKEWFGYDRGQPLLISEFVLNSSGSESPPKSVKDIKYSTLLKKLDDIDSLGRSLSEPSTVEQSLISYHFVAVHKISLSPNTFNVVVYVAQKVEEDEQCFLDCAEEMRKEDFLRRLSACAVCALRYLHDQKMAHGHIARDSLWCTKSSLRFSDYCLRRSLLKLCEYFNYYTGKVKQYDPTEEKARKTRDLRDLASLLKEIMSNSAFVEGEESVEELNSFISLCENARNIEELVQHQYFSSGAIILESDSSVDSRHVAVQQKDTRLMKEFIIQKYLGKGAFGDVVQAKNKLDWSDYAVKCITLDPMDDQLSRKITREAKLFSKLNHYNVVRYFNAWIETITAPPRRSRSSTGRDPIFSHTHDLPLEGKRFDLEDDLLPSRLQNLEVAADGLLVDANEWTASCRGPEPAMSSSEEEDTTDDESHEPAPIPDESSNSVSILFESENIPEASGSPAIRHSNSGLDHDEQISKIFCSPSPRSPGLPLRVLFIQMEYCGGGTLRKCIDDGNLRDNPRIVWRLFAEILSGLAYVHQQGMIHRDIKPMNILLDSAGHVKIGDFGLATKDLLLKKVQTACASGSESLEQALTKDVGTETYMAPELFDVSNPEPYTSKIDVYSTGIVFFEMCNRPIPTGMERHAIIADLKSSLTFPEDFGEGFSSVQAKHVRHLIKWMLNPEADRRPTVEELLRDDHIPLVDVEDKQFKKIFMQSLKSRNRTYYWMLDAISKEEPPPARTYCYDQDICKEKFNSSRDEYIACLRDDLTSILRMHAFVPLTSHLLVPQSKCALESYRSMRSKPAIMVDSLGHAVMLPMDLRQNFVRFCARNSINRIKRYVFDRVYANRDAKEGVHPSEGWECSVDCVGLANCASTLSADLLGIVSEIASKVLSEYKCTLRIGHMRLIDAALTQTGISDEKKQKVLQSMQDGEFNSSHTSVSKVIESVGKHIGEEAAKRLFTALPKGLSLSFFKGKCRSFLRSRDEKVKEAAEVALSEIEEVTELLNHASNFSNVDLFFDGSTVYRPSTFADGIVFYLSCAIPNLKRSGLVDAVVLAGGRYDSLLRNELHPQDIRPAHSLCLVGMSISLNVLANIKRKFSGEKPSICDALVCSYSEPLLAEKFELAKMLRESGLRTDIMHEPISAVPEILEHCVRSNIENLLVVFGENEALVMSNAVDQGKMTFTAAVDRVKKKTEELVYRNLPQVVPSSPATFANCLIVYATADRPALNTKRKIENQIRVGLVGTFAQFSSAEKITVIITPLSADLIKSVTSSVNKGTGLDEVVRVFDTLCKASGKSKGDMERLYEQMKKIFEIDRKARPSIIIYRIQDGTFQVIS